MRPQNPRPPRERKTGRLTNRAAFDAHGIYGTRTAHRIRSARQRRAMQNLRALGIVLLCILGSVLWLRALRVPRVKPTWVRALPITPSAPAAMASAGRESWLLQPSESGFLLPLRASDGATGKTFLADFSLRAEPEVRGAIAFLPCEDGVLRAVDWQRGVSLWSVSTSASLTTRPVLITLDARATMTPASTREVIVAANDGGEVVACDAANGRVLWRRQAGAAAGNALVGASLNGMSSVLVPLLGGLGTRGGILCLAARDGRTMWRSELGAARVAPPVVENVTEKNNASTRGIVYSAGDDGSIFRLDLATGKKLEGGGWRSGKIFATPLENAPPGEAVVLRGEALVKTYNWGTVYVVGGNDGSVRCYHARTASLLWSFDAGFPVRFRPVPLRLDVRGRPLKENTPRADEVITRDLLFIAGDGETVFALDAQTGAPVWQFSGAGESTGPAIIKDERLLRLTRQGYLQSFQLP
jgi:outer membrane protein assembly factor BamB